MQTHAAGWNPTPGNASVSAAPVSAATSRSRKVRFHDTRNASSSGVALSARKGRKSMEKRLSFIKKRLLFKVRLEKNSLTV